MTGAEIITYFEHRGVRLRLAGSELEIDAPEAALTPALIARVKERKAELLAFLQSAAEQYDWKTACADLFAVARAKVERNVANDWCPDCGGDLIENKLGDEAAQYCATCDFTWRAEDFAEIRATLVRLNRQQRKAA